MRNTRFGAHMRIMARADESFDAHTYPASTGELIDEYGDLELELPNGTETLGEALARAGEETYETAEAAKLAARCGVSEKGIGRKFYSDRDAPTVGEEGPGDVSL